MSVMSQMSPPSGLFLLLTLLLLGLHSTLAGFEHRCGLAIPRIPTGLCGNKLADTLSIVCSASYYGMTNRRKRSQDDDEAASVAGKAPKWITSPDVFLPKNKALNVLERHKRGIHGAARITCECCYNRCNIREMSQYCTSSNSVLYNKRSIPAYSSVHNSDTHSRLQRHQTDDDPRISQEKQDLKEKQAIGREIMRYGAALLDNLSFQDDAYHTQIDDADLSNSEGQDGHGDGQFTD